MPLRTCCLALLGAGYAPETAAPAVPDPDPAEDAAPPAAAAAFLLTVPPLAPFGPHWRGPSAADPKAPKAFFTLKSKNN